MLMAPAAPARRGGNGGKVVPRAMSRQTVKPRVAASLAGGPLVEIQRARILSAMLDCVTRHGVANVSVADVVECSGVSRRTFYELFVDREDCFCAAFEQALSDASERAIPAFKEAGGWQQGVRAALVALLSFFDSHPRVGRVLVTESLGGGPKVAARRNQIIAELTSIVEAGAGEGKDVFSPPSLAGEGAVGGVLAVIQRRLCEEPHTPLLELVNPLMSMIVLPYLGPAASRRELQQPTPKRSPSASEPEPATTAGDPFKSAGMRLTYRTVRVLLAVSEHPGVSNRSIADVAEIKDQGQTSKL